MAGRQDAHESLSLITLECGAQDHRVHDRGGGLFAPGRGGGAAAAAGAEPPPGVGSHSVLVYYLELSFFFEKLSFLIIEPATLFFPDEELGAASVLPFALGAAPLGAPPTLFLRLNDRMRVRLEPFFVSTFSNCGSSSKRKRLSQCPTLVMR